MKKVLALLLAVALTAGCSQIDEINSRLDAQELRLSNLESLCQTLNQNQDALALALKALQEKDCIVSVTPVKVGDKITAYVIKFEKNGEVTIFNGIDGSNGSNGIDGVTPQFMIEDGYWFVSYDRGTTWIKAGPATGEDADPVLAEVKVGENEVTFVTADGASFSIPRYAADHLNLPNNIIVIDKLFEDVNKQDTLYIDFIVNPSDFDIEQGKFSLMTNHNLFTKYDVSTSTETGKSTETPFDKNAHCDFNIVAIEQYPDYEGFYRMALAVGGEGNFFDDSQSFLAFTAADSHGKERHVVSNEPVTINVIPFLEEALRVEAPNQSFYEVSLPALEYTSVKPFGIGVWLNWYKSEGGMYRVYQREKIEAVEIGGEILPNSGKFVNEEFQTKGLVTFTPNESAEFWADAIAARDSVDCISVPDASVIVKRGRELKEIPFTYNVFPNSVANVEVRKTIDQVKANGNRAYFDIYGPMTAAGLDESFKTLTNISQKVGSVTQESSQSGLELEDSTLAMFFWSLKFFEENDSVSGVCEICKRWESFQMAGGQFIPSAKAFNLVNFFAKTTLIIVEEPEEGDVK